MTYKKLIFFIVLAALFCVLAYELTSVIDNEFFPAGNVSTVKNKRLAEAKIAPKHVEKEQPPVSERQELRGQAPLPTPAQNVNGGSNVKQQQHFPRVLKAPVPSSLPAPTLPSVPSTQQQPQPPPPLSVPSAQQAPRSLSKAGDNGKHLPDLLLVEVTVNGQHLKDVARAEQLAGGSLLLSTEAWIEARLNPLAQITALSDGTPAYALDAVPGATYRIDRQNMTLEINAPASAFVGSRLGLQDSFAVPPPRPQPGVMLNYDLSLTHDRGSQYNGKLEAVAFNKFGNIVTSALASEKENNRSFTRLDTYWNYDFPSLMETLVVGDTIGVSGGWSNPVRFGGVRWGRDFDIRPGFVTMPQISVAGEAALPSTMDVLVNNARRLSQPLQPGPFDVANVPIVTGAGEIDLVMRDILGRETVVRQSYYASPQLLAPGLTDFSFESGWLRTGYGLDGAYGSGFGAATWRQGLSNSLTGGSRLELQDGRCAAGVDLATLLGTWGVGNLALAAASDKLQDSQEKGYLLMAGIERSTPLGGGALHYQYASQGFAPLGEAIGPATATHRARESWLASLGGTLRGSVSGGVAFASQSSWDGSSVKLLSLSLNMPLSYDVSLTMSANKRLDADRSSLFMVMANFSLDGGIHATSQVNRNADGELTGAVSAMQNAPSSLGLGWRVQAATTESQRAQAELQYNTNYSEWDVYSVADADGQVSSRVGDRGTVGWFDSMAFASRPVGKGSVAVVKVDSLEGIPVTRSNQVVATTDARGKAFVPGLLPWQQNKIEIDPVDLPLDVEIGSTTQMVTPYPRSGVVVDFSVRRTRQALLVLHQSDGTPVPLGARVRLLPSGPEFITGHRGEVWLTDLAESLQRLQVVWPKGSCTLELNVPISPDGKPSKIGPMICEEGRP